MEAEADDFVPDYEEEEPESKSPADQGEPGRSQSREEKFKVPERVKMALQRSKDIEDYKKHRIFRYLHLFSGETDMLATAIKKEATKSRLQVETKSLDKKSDKSLDLSNAEAFLKIQKEVDEHLWDGVHSGFPCSSFSRVRWRSDPNGSSTGPLRAAHIRTTGKFGSTTS